MSIQSVDIAEDIAGAIDDAQSECARRHRIMLDNGDLACLYTSAYIQDGTLRRERICRDCPQRWLARIMQWL